MVFPIETKVISICFIGPIGMFAKNLSIIPIRVSRMCDFYERPINPAPKKRRVERVVSIWLCGCTLHYGLCPLTSMWNINSSPHLLVIEMTLILQHFYNSASQCFLANLKYTNKLSLELPLQTHLTLYATTFHCHIVESKEFTRSEIWNSHFATKSRVACVQNHPFQ